MAIDWKNLREKYGTGEKETSKQETKEVKEVNQAVETKAAKIIQFDQTHIPHYRAKEEYMKHVPKEVQHNVVLRFQTKEIPKEYQAQVLEYKKGKEIAVQMAKDLQKEKVKEHHDHEYRISLVKDKEEKLNDILLKHKEEWDKDVQQGKEIPEIIITSPYQEQIGAPVPVNEFLDKMKAETLIETAKDDWEKSYLIDSVYDRAKDHELEYDSSRIQEENEKSRYFSVRDNAMVPMSDRYEELEAALKEANEELIDKDKYEFSDGGIVHDTTMLGDAANASSQKRGRIQEQGAAEQERLEYGRDTGNKEPAPLDAIRDDEWANASATTKTKNVYYSETYNMEQDISEQSGEEAAIEQEVREEQQDRAEEEPIDSMQTQDEPEQEENHMSYRDQIEAEDREYWEEDLVREF